MVSPDSIKKIVAVPIYGDFINLIMESQPTLAMQWSQIATSSFFSSEFNCNIELKKFFVLFSQPELKISF